MPVGGHNVLEPAAVGTAVVVGPHVANVAADVERLLASGGAVQAARRRRRSRRARRRSFARRATRRGDGAARAAAAVGAQQGPLAVTLAIVRGTLAGDGDRRRGPA